MLFSLRVCLCYLQWFQGIRFLKKLTEGRHLLAYKTRPLTDGTGYFGYLSIEGDPININEKVVSEGFASKRPAMGGRGDAPMASSGYTPSNSFGSMDKSPIYGSNNSLNSYMSSESGFGNRNRPLNNGVVPGHQIVQNAQLKGRSPQRNISMPPATFSVPPPLLNSKYSSPTKVYNTNSVEDSASQQRY